MSREGQNSDLRSKKCIQLLLLLSMLGLQRNLETPLAYGPTIRQDLLMIEMPEALLEEVYSSG